MSKNSVKEVILSARGPTPNSKKKTISRSSGSFFTYMSVKKSVSGDSILEK